MTSNTAYAESILIEAFMDDPVARWLFPDRRRLQAYFYRSLLSHPAAEVCLTDARDGVSIWLPLTATEGDGPPELGPRLRALGHALAERHPAGPHVYLACMGVVAARRGAGRGSEMLRARLTRADREGEPAYLEASSQRSRTLYQRHGFKDVGDPIHVEDSPPLWPMRRAPKGKR
jgi:GNAT superfamily N-acetyltransferase